MKECIFCQKQNEAKSIEHIVSEGLGNKKYAMPKETVCDVCNSKFSKFEDTALSKSILLMERARNGIATKKGKNAKGKINDIKIEGRNFGKNQIRVSGFIPENYDPTDNTYQIRVQSFSKSESATSKLLLKMALESIYFSQNSIYKNKNYDFTNLRTFLVGNFQNDWGFTTVSKNKDFGKFKSIPKMHDKFLLGKIPCKLEYLELESNQILFKFTYGAICMIINLNEFKPNWAVNFFQIDDKMRIFPQHYHNKLINNPSRIATTDI